MRCPNCGNENPPDYVFCDECGARLMEETGTDGSGSRSGPMPEPDDSTTQGGSTPLGDTTPGNIPDQGESSFNSMVITPHLNDAPDGDNPVPSETESSAAYSEASSHQQEQIPVTEDTVSSEHAHSGNMEADGSGLASEPMPDVVPIGATAGSNMGAGAASALMSAPDISPAASGAPAMAADNASTTWAATALQNLDEAQQSMARGDYVGYGQSLGTLRALLESIVAGSAGSGTARPEDSGGSAAPASLNEVGTQSSGSAAESPDSLGSIPMVEPAAEAGTLAAEPVTMATAHEETAAAPSTDGGGAAMARLVVISTGAELSLPEQEEITVGREDPSSGIFPDVDLTPYGGEEGGVSRRHARLLHIADDYFVEDLQATNFTKLDGQRLPAHAREKIEDGARLDFGRVAVIFRRS